MDTKGLLLMMVTMMVIGGSIGGAFSGGLAVFAFVVAGVLVPTEQVLASCGGSKLAN